MNHQLLYFIIGWVFFFGVVNLVIYTIRHIMGISNPNNNHHHQHNPHNFNHHQQQQVDIFENLLEQEKKKCKRGHGLTNIFK